MHYFDLLLVNLPAFLEKQPNLQVGKFLHWCLYHFFTVLLSQIWRSSVQRLFQITENHKKCVMCALDNIDS